MAERVFRTLKPGRRAEDFRLTGFFSFSSAQASIAKAIHAYKTFRPHTSVGYLTPNQAHRRSVCCH
ncbi:integrase core domain-containing protein [Dyadobacter chenwenxiniae]|uniref:integrase core domain-containing protein n=1 Tax=Dyadobacter chenwenxiniae TaxID=2906456 RepID=UPI0035B63FAF